MAELMKLVQIENSKRTKKTGKQKQQERIKKHNVKQEAEKQVAVIRKKKKQQKAKQLTQAPKPKAILKVGDSVRMEDGRAVGTIDTIEKGKATVNYGTFITKVALEQLELVKAKKR